MNSARSIDLQTSTAGQMPDPTPGLRGPSIYSADISTPYPPMYRMAKRRQSLREK